MRATDGTTPDTEDITITITDVGITVTDTSANLAETAADSDAVVDVDNTGDDDIAMQWSITGGNTDGDSDGNLPFAINAGTGAITVNDADDLDFETTTSYDLTVQATDGATQTDTEVITITITDVAPTVTDTSANLAESAAANAAVVTVSTTGDDEGLTWSITAGNTDGDSDGNLPFAINSGTGAITVNDADDLDFETTTSYDLTVQATDGTTADTEVITITITDVGITVTDTSANLAETAADSDAVVDVDNTGDDDIAMQWSITGGNTDGDSDGNLPFAINSGTGAITVNDADDLDFETTTSYDLTVQATDGATQTDTEVITITITDVAPTVTDTSANLAESAANSAAVVTVSTTGDDEGLTWSITAGNTDGDEDGNLPFAIDADTGAITVNDAEDLDFETTTSYTLTVRATDGTTPDTEDITITITDVAPTVADTSANLAETAADNAAVVTVTTTGDDDGLTWSITNGNTDGDTDGQLPFAIDADTGAITVNDADDLDFETTTSYDLTVQATDGTTPDTEVITITITDVAPTVTDTSANLAETAANSAAVVTVSTTGDDEGLTWSITAGNTDGDSDGNLPFAINSGTGAITVNDADDLDFETTTSYDLTVQATDGTTPDTEVITITITDVAPTVTDTSANLAETAANSAAVVTVSTTGDDEGLTWSITAGNTDGDEDGNLPFAINSGTGAITVNDADDLDFETTTSYTLTVRATDGTTPDTEDITITITDVGITVTDTSANLAETAADSDAVVDVDNTGDDDIAMQWSITGGNTDGDSDGNLPFAINAGTGAITVNDADDLDFETTTSYDLTVQATDGATQTDTEVITITITDVAPTVTDTSANLAESAAANAAVVTVSTTGDDEGLTWSITAGNTDGDSDGNLPFAINSGTGAITVNDADDLDFETTTSYDLTVQATDGTTADTEVITITITDVAITVTDTAANLAETAANSAAVVDVDNTGDDDIAMQWSITAGNTDGDSDGNLPFAINSGTGVITVNDADDLDFETTTSYDLTVQATDGATQTDTEVITITITDVAPTVTDTSANLAETAANSAAVVTVSTTGDDEGLTWSITAGNTDGDEDGNLPFAINSGTGAITVNDADDLDFETTTSYDLTVQATDGTTADTEVITITITDVAPTVADTSASIGEDSSNSDSVVTVTTTGDTSGLTWSITAGNTDGDEDGNLPFAIDRTPARSPSTTRTTSTSRSPPATTSRSRPPTARPPTPRSSPSRSQIPSLPSLALKPVPSMKTQRPQLLL